MKRSEAIRKVAKLSKEVNDKRRRFDDRRVAEKEMMEIVKQFNITYGEVWDYKERGKK